MALVVLRRSAQAWMWQVTAEHGGFGWPVIVNGRETPIRREWRAGLPRLDGKPPRRAIRPHWMFGRPRPGAPAAAPFWQAQAGPALGAPGRAR
jgi:hypothetical protein